MSMMDSIASASMSLSSMQLQQDYTLSVAKKAMDSQELAAQELLAMLPQQPAKGAYIDTYA